MHLCIYTHTSYIVPPPIHQPACESYVRESCVVVCLYTCMYIHQHIVHRTPSNTSDCIHIRLHTWIYTNISMCICKDKCIYVYTPTHCTSYTLQIIRLRVSHMYVSHVFWCVYTHVSIYTHTLYIVHPPIHQTAYISDYIHGYIQTYLCAYVKTNAFMYIHPHLVHHTPSNTSDCVWVICIGVFIHMFIHMYIWYLQIYVTEYLQHTTTHCNTLQHTATHCNTLQRYVTEYLQHTNSCDSLTVGSFHVREVGGWVETQKMYGERLGDGVEYHLMSPTPRR